MSEDGKVLCQQCNDSFAPEDAKQIYGDDFEVCGFICNPCCIKSVEYARRCQIVDCKTRPDSGPTGFRTLPLKFYDLPEGEVKKRIIKQFGIIRTVRACCNMCYVRISKAIVQMKIVYGDGLARQGRVAAGRASKYKAPSLTHSVIETSKTPQGKEDRLAVYTGPKFTRRSGGAPCWNKNSPKTEDNVVATSLCQIADQNRELPAEKDPKLSVEGKQSGDEDKPLVEGERQQPRQDETVIDVRTGDNGLMDLSGDSSFQNGINEDGKAATKLDNNKNEKGDKNAEVSYSSTPISPTTMRFRRIQPKTPKFEEFDLSDDLLELADFTPPGSRNGRKRSRGVEEDETWSPERAKREKRPVNTNVMSDFVSCTGCRKICSSRETQPVFDEKKGFNIRLCGECRDKRDEETAACPIKGCLTSQKDVVLHPIPSGVYNQKGNTKKQLQALGFNEEVKSCCEKCAQVLKSIVDMGDKERENGGATGEEQVFTMCRSCCKIIPMKDTFPNIEEDGRKCGVVCHLCLGKDKKDSLPLQETEVKKEIKGQRKTKLYESMKTLGFCTAKGCVHAGEKEPVQLVCGKKILRNYLDEKMLRAEFDLDDDTDYCCRSCHARIKWFVADIKKKEHGPGADGKAVNSLKNLNPRIKMENVKQEDGKHDQEAKCNESKENGYVGEEVLRKRFIFSDEGSCTQTGQTGFKMAHPKSKYAQEIKTEKTEVMLPHVDGYSNQSPMILQASSSTTQKPAIFIPPMNSQISNLTGHPPVLQVGRQQFVLNVISRCEKDTQTENIITGRHDDRGFGFLEKGVQVNIPLMPKFEGTVPANLPNGKKVKYADAKEKTKYAVKRAGKELFDQFLQQLDDISGGCAHQLLSDIYRPKDTVMATNYEKILASIGMLYRNTERGNRQERLRLLSTVALHASNEALKRHFQRMSKKGDLVNVNEAEIVQAREYAKQFGPGTHVMPVGQVSWKNFVPTGMMESADDDDINEPEGAKAKETMVRGAKEGLAEMTGEEEKIDSDDSQSAQVGERTENRNVAKVNPDVPVTGKDNEKKLITFEKMNSLEPGSAERKQKQLVTFKVTVRHAKDKAANDVTEQKGAIADDNTVVGDANVSDNYGDNGEAKSGNSEKLTGKRKGRLSLDSGRKDAGKEDAKNQLKKRRRNSVGVGLADKSKKKAEVVKLEDKDGDMREKRRRTAFSSERRLVLERYFEKSIYASKSMVEEISRELNIDRKKIDNWFRNRRSKLKKDEEERSRRDVQMKVRKGWNKENSKSQSTGAKETEASNVSQSSVGCTETDGTNEVAQTNEGTASSVTQHKVVNPTSAEEAKDDQPTTSGSEERVGLPNQVFEDDKKPRNSEGIQQADNNSQKALDVQEKSDPTQKDIVEKTDPHSCLSPSIPDENTKLVSTPKRSFDDMSDTEVVSRGLNTDSRTELKTGKASDKNENRTRGDNDASLIKAKDLTFASGADESRSLKSPSRVALTPACPVAKDVAHPSDLTTNKKSPVVPSVVCPVSSDLTSVVVPNSAAAVASKLATPVGSGLTSPAPSKVSTLEMSDLTSPVPSNLSTLVVTNLASPAASNLGTPVVSNLTSPVPSKLGTPVVSNLMCPVAAKLSTPLVSNLTSPVPSKLGTPVVSNLTCAIAANLGTPVVSDLTSPVASNLGTPVVSNPTSLLAPKLGTPVVSNLTCPIVSKLATPKISDLTSPVASNLGIPVLSSLASPVALSLASPTLLAPQLVPQPGSEETFQSKQECYLGSRVVPATPWSPVIDSYDVNENNSSDVPEDLALALNNDPDFMKDLNELMDIAKA